MPRDEGLKSFDAVSCSGLFFLYESSVLARPPAVHPVPTPARRIHCLSRLSCLSRNLRKKKRDSKTARRYGSACARSPLPR